MVRTDRFFRIFLPLLLPFLLGACVNDPEQGGTKLVAGNSLPEFSVTTSSGEVVTNHILSQGRSVIVFFSTSCDDCRRILPLVEEAYRNSGSGTKYICIARDEGEETISRFWEEHRMTLPYSSQPDRRIYSLFADSGIPMIYLTDNGKIIAVYSE